MPYERCIETWAREEGIGLTPGPGRRSAPDWPKLGSRISWTDLPSPNSLPKDSQKPSKSLLKGLPTGTFARYATICPPQEPPLFERLHAMLRFALRRSLPNAYQRRVLARYATICPPKQPPQATQRCVSRSGILRRGIAVGN